MPNSRLSNTRFGRFNLPILVSRNCLNQIPYIRSCMGFQFHSCRHNQTNNIDTPWIESLIRTHKRRSSKTCNIVTPRGSERSRVRTIAGRARSCKAWLFENCSWVQRNMCTNNSKPSDASHNIFNYNLQHLCKNQALQS